MAPSQTDAASWAVGRADSVATRTGSRKPGQGGGAVRIGRLGWQGGIVGTRHFTPEGLKNARGRARGRAARVAHSLSSYGQSGKGGGQRPESGQKKDSPL